MNDVTLPPPPELTSHAAEPCIVELPLKIPPSLRVRLTKLKENGRTREVNAYLRTVLEAGIAALEEKIPEGEA